ncbi:MAG: aldehyde dehydrogenase family protein, partial [Candidatus Nanopelagicales bacterium]
MTTSLIPGIDQSVVTPVLLTGSWTTGTGGAIEVRSPFDDALLGSVPALSPTDVDAAVAYAHRTLEASPLPQWQRAEILDRAAVLLAARREEFGIAIAREAAKPIKTARVEVDRAVSTLQFSAAVARTLAGEVVPMEASPVGVGKIGF